MRRPLVLAALLLAACGDPPVPAGPAPLRIMPLGDSITQGSKNQESYRRRLWLLLAERDVAVDFVGGLDENHGGPGPHDDFDRDHEGHWAWSADQVLARIDAWAAAARPDVVLLHIGTNDLGREEGIDPTVAEVRGIIAGLRRANPRVAVLLAQVFPTRDVRHNRTLEAYNARLAELAGELHREDAPVVIVDHYGGVDLERDFADFVHPNERGADKMAQRWLEALLPLLPNR